MNPNRIPKRCYCNTAESRRAQNTADKHSDTLKDMEQKIDAGAAHIGLVVADIFTFLTKSAAMLPDIELHTENIDLTVNDDGIAVHISRPAHNVADDYEEEEEFLYDGD